MKSFIKYIATGVLSVSLFSACSGDKLDTNPTDSMSGSSLFASANAALVPLNGIYRYMYSYLGNHESFGNSAYTVMNSIMADDYVIYSGGNGWFEWDAMYKMNLYWTNSGERCAKIWEYYYKLVANANYIIAAEETMGGTESDVAYVMGQAYAIRAYAYMNLAGYYSRTYIGHEDEPCVPIYTGSTVAGTKGNPRSTVKEVFALIQSDIKKAVDYLAVAGKSRQEHSSHICYAVASQLQARVALEMNDWATAESAATNAIEASKAMGKHIAKVEEFKGLNNHEAANVLWAAEIISDQSTTKASLFSHLDTLSYGEGQPKAINKELYAQIADNDSRKAWWITSPKNRFNVTDEEGNVISGYLQDKFHFSNAQSYLGDYVWMRVEELYLAKAEACCRLGKDAEAREALETLVKTRQADYSCASKSGKELPALTSDYVSCKSSLLCEIIKQRRIELWGEYERLFEIKRLKQGFVRTTDQGWNSSYVLKSKSTDNPETWCWVFALPQKEFDGNSSLDPAKDQNPIED